MANKNIQRLHVVVMGSPNSLLQRWLTKRTIQYRISPRGAYAVDADRNQAMEHFMRHEVHEMEGDAFPGPCTHVVMIDDDIVPLAENSLDNLFKVHSGDLLYCGKAGTAGTSSHFGDGDFGASACRISASLLGRMRQPWFLTRYDSDQKQRIECECIHFRKQAEGLAASEMVGIVGHQQGGDGGAILVPSPESTHGWGILWPQQLSREK